MNPHFVLVHGAGHGGWCWFKLLNLLHSAGHHATALDLTAAGVDPTKLEEVTSIHHHAHPLMDFIEALPQQQKVILVGHSFGGLIISLAMEAFPHRILVAVFVTAYMPHFLSPPATLVQRFFKSLSPENLLDCQFLFGDDPEMPSSVVFGLVDSGKSDVDEKKKKLAEGFFEGKISGSKRRERERFAGHNFTTQKLYDDCSNEDLELGNLLMRPFKMFFEDLKKESILTEVKFGSVDRVFVVCEGDEVMNSEFQRSMIQEFPPKAVKCINGGGHMVMLSKPTQLFQHLIEIGESFNSTNECDHQAFNSCPQLN